MHAFSKNTHTGHAHACAGEEMHGAGKGTHGTENVYAWGWKAPRYCFNDTGPWAFVYWWASGLLMGVVERRSSFPLRWPTGPSDPTFFWRLWPLGACVLIGVWAAHLLWWSMWGRQGLPKTPFRITFGMVWTARAFQRHSFRITLSAPWCVRLPCRAIAKQTHVEPLWGLCGPAWVCGCLMKQWQRRPMWRLSGGSLGLPGCAGLPATAMAKQTHVELLCGLCGPARVCGLAFVQPWEARPMWSFYGGSVGLPHRPPESRWAAQTPISTQTPKDQCDKQKSGPKAP